MSLAWEFCGKLSRRAGGHSVSLEDMDKARKPSPEEKRFQKDRRREAGHRRSSGGCGRMTGVETERQI